MSLDRPLSKLALISLIVIIQSVRLSQTLRTGAPALACINLRPFHGLHRAKPASSSQFFVSQSSLSHSPGQNITVEVATHSNERYFRGFIVQAYDPSTGAQIGHFLPTSESRPIDSCSATTHRSNTNKKQVLLTWIPSSSDDPSAANGFDSTVAGQWLGLRAPSRTQIQPHLSVTTSNQKRQLGPVENNATLIAQPPQVAHVQHAPTSSRHQVRFRATVVVTYEEFYTGFESSDQSFDKFGYANGEQSRQLSPSAGVAVATSTSTSTAENEPMAATRK